MSYQITGLVVLMGTIVARDRKDGSTGYTAQIVLKRKGRKAHREAKTFDRKQAAIAWLKKRETELAAPGALDRAAAKPGGATLGEAIDRYTEASKRIGRTKAQCLRTIKEFSIADMQCAAIGSADVVALAQELGAGGRKPQTVGNYISHLGAVFAVARSAWGYELDRAVMKDAHDALRGLGTTSKSAKRDRRPSLEEVDRLMNSFATRLTARPDSSPMHRIMAFAIFSTRRMEEITRIRWADLDEGGSRVMVRDMKHPGDMVGNDVWTELPAEALAIVKAMPRTAAEIFPYSVAAIGAAFTRAVHTLGIVDLHFHDLRHDGVSRLFEMGRTVPQAAIVSGHRSWASLQRYTHVRQTGDKYAGWRWLAAVTAASGG